MNKNKKILTLIFIGFGLISAAILFLAVHTKTKIAKEAIAKIEKKGGIIVSDDTFHSRGLFNDTVQSIASTFGYETELGHKAYTLNLNDKFENSDIISVNAVPHIKALNINSSKMTNEALLNLHGSDLLEHMTLENLKCDKDGLKHLIKFKNLKTLTVVKLDYVNENDFSFVSQLTLEQLAIHNMKVLPLHFTETNKVPAMTKVVIK